MTQETQNATVIIPAMTTAINTVGLKPGESPITISDCIRLNLDKFFDDLEGENAKAVYDMVLSAVERPMLEVVMAKANMNQTIASQMLGINRNTLRKKLQQHGLI